MRSGGKQPEDAHLISDHPAPALNSRDVYCYFDNDVKVKAPFDARKLLQRLGLETGLAELDWSHTEPGEVNPTKARGRTSK